MSRTATKAAASRSGEVFSELRSNVKVSDERLAVTKRLKCYSNLFENFTPLRKRLDAVDPRLVADARSRWHTNRATAGDFNFRLNDVFVPIASTSRHVTWKIKIRQ